MISGPVGTSQPSTSESNGSDLDSPLLLSARGEPSRSMVLSSTLETLPEAETEPPPNRSPLQIFPDDAETQFTQSPLARPPASTTGTADLSASPLPSPTDDSTMSQEHPHILSPQEIKSANDIRIPMQQGSPHSYSSLSSPSHHSSQNSSDDSWFQFQGRSQTSGTGSPDSTEQDLRTTDSMLRSTWSELQSMERSRSGLTRQSSRFPAVAHSELMCVSIVEEQAISSGSRLFSFGHSLSSSSPHFASGSSSHFPTIYPGSPSMDLHRSMPTHPLESEHEESQSNHLDHHEIVEPITQQQSGDSTPIQQLIRNQDTVPNDSFRLTESACKSSHPLFNLNTVVEDTEGAIDGPQDGNQKATASHCVDTLMIDGVDQNSPTNYMNDSLSSRSEDSSPFQWYSEAHANHSSPRVNQKQPESDDVATAADFIALSPRARKASEPTPSLFKKSKLELDLSPPPPSSEYLDGPFDLESSIGGQESLTYSLSTRRSVDPSCLTARSLLLDSFRQLTTYEEQIAEDRIATRRRLSRNEDSNPERVDLTPIEASSFSRAFDEHGESGMDDGSDSIISVSVGSF